MQARLEVARTGARATAACHKWITTGYTSPLNVFSIVDDIVSWFALDHLQNASLPQNEQHKIAVAFDTTHNILKTVRTHLIGQFSDEAQTQRAVQLATHLFNAVRALVDSKFGSSEGESDADPESLAEDFSGLVVNICFCVRYNLKAEWTIFLLIFLLDITKMVDCIRHASDAIEGRAVLMNLLDAFKSSILENLDEIGSLVESSAVNSQGRRKLLELYERLLRENTNLAAVIQRMVLPFIKANIAKGQIKALLNQNYHCELWFDGDESLLDAQGLRQLISLGLAGIQIFVSKKDRESILYIETLFLELSFNHENIPMFYTFISESDSYLISILINLAHLSKLLLDVEVYQIVSQMAPNFMKALDIFSIHNMFIQFIMETGADVTTLVDLLMSSETRFLELLLAYLNFWFAELSANSPNKKRKRSYGGDNALGRQSAVLAVLKDLAQSLTRLHSTKLFPYNPTPLINKINKILELNL